MAGYRMTADARGQTHLEPMDLSTWPFENGPGEFKGVGGAAMGDASRVMLMRFETGAHPGLHRAVPGFLVVLSGELVVTDSAGTEIALQAGDTLRCETTGRGGWRLGNRGEQNTLVALVQMPPKKGGPATEVEV